MTLAVVSCAELASCPVCWACPGIPCGDGWDHLARYGRAKRRGLISADESARAAKLATGEGEHEIVWQADARVI